MSLLQVWVLRVSRRLLLLWRRQSRPPSLTLAASRSASASLGLGFRKMPPPESPEQTKLGMDQSAQVSSTTLRSVEVLMRRFPSHISEIVVPGGAFRLGIVVP